MNFFKKFLIFVSAILLCASIYHDMTSGSISTNEERNTRTTTSNSLSYSIEKVQISPGETVLSIVEKYNDGGVSLNVDQILTDFRKLNPDVHPYQLEAYHYYNFPVYKK